MNANNVKGAAIIGAGVIFKEHARAYAALGSRVRLIGIAELDDKKLDAATNQFYIPVATTDYKELLQRDDIDIVSICTPPAYHEDIVVDALQAGKHVVCEKPLATNLAAVDQIKQRCSPDQLERLSTVYQLRYSPEIQRIIWLRDHGHLGDLVYGHATRLSTLTGTNAQTGSWWGNWKTSGGGVVITQFIHHLDQLYYIFGNPIEVDATMGTKHHPIESEESFGAQIVFESGAIVSCSATVTAHGLAFSLDVVGTKASVHMPWSIRSLRKNDASQAKQAVDAAMGGDLKKMKVKQKIGFLLNKNRLISLIGSRIRAFPPPPPGHKAYLASVMDAMDRSEPLPLGIDEARVSLEMCQAIYQSALTGQRVQLPLEPSSLVYAGISAADFVARQEEQNELN